MASYSAVQKHDILHPGPEHSTPVHPSALDSDESGSEGDGATILVTLQKRWKCVAIVTSVLVVVMVVVVVGLAVKLTTTQCTTTMPLTIREQQQRTADLTQLTISEQHAQQQREVAALPRCGLVHEGIKVIDILGNNPSDEVLQGTLMTHNIIVTRCRGLCVGNNHCLPVHTLNKSFVVKYKDNHGAIQYTKRHVHHHLECQCQEA